MPADRGNAGMGARRQGPTDPDRSDDRNRELERQYDAESAREAANEIREAGRQPGAHGNETPHRNVKPGTRDALEELERGG